MSSIFGNKLKMSIFGQSHSGAIGVVLDGLPAGIELDLEQIRDFMRRRAPASFGSDMSTARKEDDEFEIISGVVSGRSGSLTTCGAPLAAIIKNKDAKSGDYAGLASKPRPGHADYTAKVKYNGFEDSAGGGHFSGRMTAPMCLAGAICQQFIGKMGIVVASRLKSVGAVEDAAAISVDDVQRIKAMQFPVIDSTCAELMRAEIQKARMQGDSVGGIVECAVFGMPVGVGDPMFDALDARLAYLMFGIPGVKGVEFGLGFKAAKVNGSENNDAFYVDCSRVDSSRDVQTRIQTRTNNCGGILGGISNGMPVILRVAFKPTPSIAKLQQTVDLKAMCDTEIEVRGRHDPCIAVRGAVVVEACAAIVIADYLV